jgi:hypothetical protein
MPDAYCFFKKNKNMEMPTHSIESIFESVEAYIKTTIELSKLKALDTVSGVITALISRVIICIVMTLFVIFLSVGMALFLGSLLEKTYYGFFIVAAFYLVMGAILSFSLQNWLKESMGDSLISQLKNKGD